MTAAPSSGPLDKTQLFGLDALSDSARTLWADLQGLTSEYGPNLLWALLLVVVYGLLYLLVSRLALALLRRFVDDQKHPLTRRSLRTMLRLTFLMLLALSVSALFPALAAYGPAIFRVYLLLLVLYVGWMVIHHLVEVQAEQHWQLDASLKLLLDNTLRTLWALTGIYLIFQQFGVNLLPVLGGLGVVGIALGFAAQDILANLISGITLLLDRPFRLGDWIRVRDYEGQVSRLTLRTTRIYTRDNEHVSIPNREVAGASVVNLTKGGRLRLNVPVVLSYHDRVEDARQVILPVLKEHPNVLDDPAPVILVRDLDEKRVELIMRFWVTPENVATYPVTTMQLREAAKEALAAAGFHLPYPQLNVNMEPDDSARRNQPDSDKA